MQLIRRPSARLAHFPRAPHQLDWPAYTSRRGSSLMIVMVLMGMLALLGVLFYTFAAQERSSAEYYAESAKSLGPTSLTADTLFDWALQQIIVGTDPRLTNSMLWGSRHSMLSNSLGVGVAGPGDIQPFNGEGISLIYDANGNVAVDQDRNGLADDGTSYTMFTPNIPQPNYTYLLDYNDSPAAPKYLDPGVQAPYYIQRQIVNGTTYFPKTDVGYTYPDINNVFVTYTGKVRDNNGNVHQVVKPAYMVPGILRAPIGGVSAPLIFEDLNYNGVLDPGEDTNGNGFLDDWTVNPYLGSRIMRGHPSHVYVPSSGVVTGTPTRRYMTNAEAISLIGPSAFGFPWHPMDPTYNTTGSPGAAGQVFVPGKMGPYSGIDTNLSNVPPIEPIQFDYDNDGDGINEAILMDLDFPPQQDSSGKMFVPLFLITIHDLDALMNVNAHGNLSKLLYGPNDQTQANTPLSNTFNAYGYNTAATPQFYYVSQSNLGLGPSEVNPLWVLNARIGVDNNAASTLFQTRSQYSWFFGNNPLSSGLSGPNPLWGETANMEFTWSKIGRLQYSSSGSITSYYPGSYGEPSALYAAATGGTLSHAGGQTLPRPGASLFDDNGDVNEGQNDYPPYFQHPLDYTGQGSYLSTSSPKNLNWSAPSGADQWITYSDYSTNSTTPASSNVAWGQGAGLMNNSLTQALGDDPNEVSFYTPNNAIDNIYTPDEMLYLNLTNADINRLNITSRLSNIFPFNFAKNTNDNARGAAIRRKFTTESNDRKSFGFPVSVRAFGSAGAGQEYNLDPLSGTYKFPPQFGTAANPIPRYTAGTMTPYADDPFRIPTRQLLEIEWNSYQTKGRLQRKLSVNQLLSQDGTNPMAFRDLTPHPVDAGPTVIDLVTNVTAYPPTTPAGEEYWARRDRQRMARDIYVLLYLLGHGDDTMNTAATSNANPTPATNGNTPYSEPQLREMAQFAVNLVDSMDRDNVITRFEYDKDLSDGWNLDDDPYTSDGYTPYAYSAANYNPSYPNDSAARGEVYGIERLDLTLSEALAIRALQSPSGMNLTQTNYDEAASDRYFFFAELRNASPFPIKFSSTNPAWQIVLRQELTTAPSGSSPAYWERALILKNNVTLDSNNSPTSNTSYVVGSTDSSASSSAFSRSTFAVDPNWVSTPTVRTAPNKPTGTTVLDCDLDLIETPGSSGMYQILDETGTDVTNTVGAMWTAFSQPTPGASKNGTLKVLLRRRASMTRSTVAATDNPWVEVDSIVLQSGKGYGTFTASASSTPTTIQNHLNNLSSRERPQPLDGASEAPSTGGYGGSPTPYALNTLGGQNSVTSAANNSFPFNMWQLHFDRSYASLLDLLYVPVFGPHQLTKLSTSAIKQPPDTQVTNAVGSPEWQFGPPGSSTPYTVSYKSAASKFMVPEDPANITATTYNYYMNNRWHRLLDFLEVPTRTNVNLGVGTALTIPRVPGRMNLNMLRYGDTLGALLDDSRLMYLNMTPSGPPTDPEAPFLADNTGETARDWWQQFLASRDPLEPTAATKASPISVPLPGLPNTISALNTQTIGLLDARPFRSSSDVGYNPTQTGSTGTAYAKRPSINDTILRGLPLDSSLAPTISRRRLLEVGNQTEHQNGTIDPYIRNRLLTKIAGNSTTRSNCFAVFISVKYFQAAEQNGAIRIGGPVNGTPNPEFRGFFVIDRSKLESGQTSSGLTYDFNAFVDYRMTLQSQ